MTFAQKINDNFQWNGSLQMFNDNVCIHLNYFYKLYFGHRL